VLDDGREPFEDQIPGTLPRDAGLLAHFSDFGFTGEVGEPGALPGQDVVHAVGAQAGGEEDVDPAVADDAEVVAQADLARRPVVAQRLGDQRELLVLVLRVFEVVAGHDEEGVDPQGEEELQQPGDDVTGGQAEAELEQEQGTDEPEIDAGCIGHGRRVGLLLVDLRTLELGDLPSPHGQSGEGDAEFVERMARDPEQGMEPKHAVEERLLHIGAGTQIGMVQ
jgi:hypothetical protein